jgi:GNAT superfamily N-acetyltransferase
MNKQDPEIRYRAVTSETLADLTTFSGCHGKFQYCSCMRWRMRSAEFQKSTKLAPRESYEALERNKALPRVDHASVWSVICFFVDRRFRRSQVTRGLLKAGLDYARSQGAKIVEGYPVEPGARLYTYMGSPATFRKAGFQDVTPKGQQRKIVRCTFK